MGVPSYLADATCRNVVIGRCHHEDSMGVTHARFHKFNVGNTAGEDLNMLIVDDLGNQSVQFGDISAVGIDLVVRGFEKVLYQRCTTIARRAENGVGRHGVLYGNESCKKRVPACLNAAGLFIRVNTVSKNSKMSAHEHVSRVGMNVCDSGRGYCSQLGI